MKRLIYGVLVPALAGASALCFGRSPQDMGEMVHIGASAPSPVRPMQGRSISLRASRHSRTAQSRTVPSGGVVNLHWNSSEIRSKGANAGSSGKKADAGKTPPAFVVYGADNGGADNGGADSLDEGGSGGAAKPQAAPEKTGGAGSSPPPS